MKVSETGWRHNPIKRKILENTEYTFCPECKRNRGVMEPMVVDPTSGFRNHILMICPKCGCSMDKQINRMMKPHRPKQRGQVFHYRMK